MKARPAVLWVVVGCLALLGLAAGVGGCSSEASAYVGGREVSASTSTLNGVSACGNGETARLVVALCVFDVTEQDIRWRGGGDHVIKLPEGWNKLQLVQSGRHVVVRVDGRVIGKIDPDA